MQSLFHRRVPEFVEFGTFLKQKLFTPRPLRLRGETSFGPMQSTPPLNSLHELRKIFNDSRRADAEKIECSKRELSRVKPGLWQAMVGAQPIPSAKTRQLTQNRRGRRQNGKIMPVYSRQCGRGRDPNAVGDLFGARQRSLMRR
jgi:hypothetical protein